MADVFRTAVGEANKHLAELFARLTSQERVCQGGGGGGDTTAHWLPTDPPHPQEFKETLHEKEQEIVRLHEELQRILVRRFGVGRVGLTLIIKVAQHAASGTAALAEQNQWLAATVAERDRENAVLRRRLARIAAIAGADVASVAASDSATTPVQ